MNMISTVGSWVMGVAVLVFLANVAITLRHAPDAADDPWEANSLEWATSSPPPKHNFWRLPQVRSERPVWDARMRAMAAVDDGATDA
jgi:cytochrome c oxidase subunit 1